MGTPTCRKEICINFREDYLVPQKQAYDGYISNAASSSTIGLRLNSIASIYASSEESTATDFVSKNEGSNEKTYYNPSLYWSSRYSPSSVADVLG